MRRFGAIVAFPIALLHELTHYAGALPWATDARVVVFNPRQDLDAVAAFDVRSVPTFLLFVDGDLIARRADGFVPTADLVAFVEGE